MIALTRCAYVEYIVLSLVTSEIEEDGTPCLVMLKLPERICGYLLSDWQRLIGSTDELSAEWLDEILKVVRLQSDGWQEQMEALFSDLAYLSVGPLRTTRVGRVPVEALILEDVSRDQSLIECNHGVLASLIGYITALDLAQPAEVLPNDTVV